MPVEAIPALLQAASIAKPTASPSARSDATGGYSQLIADHSGWNVQIGSGLNVATPSGLLPLLALGAALVMAARWKKL